MTTIVFHSRARRLVGNGCPASGDEEQLPPEGAVAEGDAVSEIKASPHTRIEM